MPWVFLMGALAMFWILADLSDVMLQSGRSHRSGHAASSAWLDWSADRLLSATERRHHAIGMAGDTAYCDGSANLGACLGVEFGFIDNQDDVRVDAPLADQSGPTGRPLLLHGGVRGYPSRYANAIALSPADDPDGRTSTKDYGLIRGRVHAGYYQSDPNALGVDARQRNGMLWIRDPAHVTGDQSDASVDRYHRLVNAPENYLPHVPLGILAGWHQGDPADPTDDAPPVAAALPIVPDFDNPDALRVPYSHRSDVIEQVFRRLRCSQLSPSDRSDPGSGCDPDWVYDVLPGSLPNGMSLADLAGVVPDRATAFLHPFTVDWKPGPVPDPLDPTSHHVMGEPCQWSDCWVAISDQKYPISPLGQGAAGDCPEPSSNRLGLEKGRLGHACLPGDTSDPKNWASALTWTSAGIEPPPYEHFQRLGTGASSGERTRLSPDLVDTGLAVERSDPADPTSPLLPSDNWFSLHWMIVDEEFVDPSLIPEATLASGDAADLPAFGPCRQFDSPPAFCRRHLSH